MSAESGRVVIPEELAEGLPTWWRDAIRDGLAKLWRSHDESLARPEVGEEVVVLNPGGEHHGEPASVHPGDPGRGTALMVRLHRDGGIWFTNHCAVLPAAVPASPALPGGSGDAEPGEDVSPKALRNACPSVHPTELGVDCMSFEGHPGGSHAAVVDGETLVWVDDEIHESSPRRSLAEALMGDRRVPPYVPRPVSERPATNIADGHIPPGPWRVGGRCPRNLYIGPEYPEGIDVGRMDSPELAARVVEAVNAVGAYDAPYRALAKSRAEVRRLREVLEHIHEVASDTRDEPLPRSLPAQLRSVATLASDALEDGS